MIPKNVEAQVDFSAGELNVDAKRTDDPLVKAGARQLSNWRILNSRKPTNRPGRTALFPTEGRVDEVEVSAGVIYRLCFGNGTLKIRDVNGAYVAGNSGYAWTSATDQLIVWNLINRSATERDIFITFNGTRPKMARWSLLNGWSFLDFAFAKNSYGALQEPFYRLAPPGMTLTPSAVSGTITCTTSDNYFTVGMIGTIIRWLSHQILLTAFTDQKNMTGIVIEQLPVTIDLGTISAVKGTFNVGDAISTTTAPRTSYEGEVSAITVAAGVVTAIRVNMFVTGQQFATSDLIVGPNGTCTAGTVAVVAPGSSVQWDEEVMNDARGWPSSNFFDQNRLGLCDIPAVPGGIAWSGIASYTNFLVGANPSDPMFEIAPNRARVYHVINKSDEFVLTGKGIWYIPISQNNPLKPGSVQFRKVTGDASAQVRPVETTEGIIFVSAGLNRICAIVPKYGYLDIPWGVAETSLYHSHLFNSPIAVAVTTADGSFQERYVYVLNSDGTLAIGKFDVAKEWAGWLPWNGTGFVNWVSALQANVIFTTTYTANAAVTIAEQVNVNQYVDGSVAINAAPAPMQAGADPTISMLLSGSAAANMVSHASPAAAFDGNLLKNAAASVGVDAPSVGFGNRLWLQISVGAQKLARLRVTAPLDAPLSAAGSTTFNIIGSNDGSTWNIVFTSSATAGVNNEQIDVTSGISQTNAYAYWGIDVFGTVSKTIAIAQLELFYLAPGTVHQAPSGGTGPMWWFAGGQCTLMDGLLPLSTHSVDATGAVRPIDAEDLSSPTLVAGLGWTATLEPFVPPAAGGPDRQQRMRKRSITRAQIYVQNSSGFVYGTRRVPPWMMSENQEIAPPLREQAYTFRPRGRAHDPRVPLVKDTPGPLTIVEIGLEVSV